MLLASEWGTGQMFWSILWFFLFVMWFWLVISIFSDIMRSDMGGWSKALWTLGVIILPFIGILLYLIIHGGDMGKRAAESAAQMEAAQRDYIRSAAGSGSAADEVEKLASLHASGSLTDEEFAAAKAKALGN